MFWHIYACTYSYIHTHVCTNGSKSCSLNIVTHVCYVYARVYMHTCSTDSRMCVHVCVYMHIYIHSRSMYVMYTLNSMYIYVYIYHMYIMYSRITYI